MISDKGFINKYPDDAAEMARLGRGSMRKPDPVEIVQISIPVLIEAVVVTFAIGVAALWVIILATPIPDVLQ